MMISRTLPFPQIPLNFQPFIHSTSQYQLHLMPWLGVGHHFTIVSLIDVCTATQLLLPIRETAPCARFTMAPFGPTTRPIGYLYADFAMVIRWRVEGARFIPS